MKNETTYIYREEDGSIDDEKGGLLYDPDCLVGLSLAAKRRLAELHSLDELRKKGESGYDEFDELREEIVEEWNV